MLLGRIVTDIEQIAKAVDDEVVSRDLVPAFVKLLKDSEAEVRTAIAGQIPGMLFSISIFDLILIHSQASASWLIDQPYLMIS